MAVILAETENMPYADWLEWRKRGIGGSDASVVCGINRWKSPIELWMEKTDQLPGDDNAGESAYWGQQLEALVRDEFTKRTGIEVRLVKQLLQSEEHPFMLANLDGMCVHPIYGDVIFEAKTSSTYRSGEWQADDIPDEYLLQVQHYMAVTGYKGAFIAVLIGGNNFKWKFVEHDDELIKIIINLETEFWNHVQNMTPPSMDGSEASTKFLSQRFPNSIPDTKIELPDTAEALIQQYNETSIQLKQLEEIKQEAENRLKELLGDNEAGVVGNNIVTWRSFSQERLDTKTLKAEHPTLFKKFSNIIMSRRFSVKAAS